MSPQCIHTRLPRSTPHIFWHGLPTTPRFRHRRRCCRTFFFAATFSAFSTHSSSNSSRSILMSVLTSDYIATRGVRASKDVTKKHRRTKGEGDVCKRIKRDGWGNLSYRRVHLCMALERNTWQENHLHIVSAWSRCLLITPRHLRAPLHTICRDVQGQHAYGIWSQPRVEDTKARIATAPSGR